MNFPEPTKYVTKLRDARVLIIGGTSGIGFGVAEALVEHGAVVFVSSSSSERVARAVTRLESTYPSARGRVRGFVCDLSSQEKLASEVERLFLDVTHDGKLDHVVHTAGDALTIGNLEDFTLQQIQQAGMVRFFSPLIVAQQLRKHLNNETKSSYTMTTGGLSQRPRPGWSVMMPYLTGLEGMGRALARDLTPIRVNLVGPGPVETDLWQSHEESRDMADLMTSLAESMVTKTFGKVEDVAESYLYLMKDRNITGSIIYTNGGGLLT